MKYLLEKTLLTMTLCMVFTVITVAGGVTAQTPEGFHTFTQEELDELASIPSANITDFILGEGEYSVGDMVSGSFDLHNLQDYDIDLMYSVSLTYSDDDSGRPTGVVDTVYGEIVSLGANEKVNQNISYNIPDNIVGENFGIRIEATTQSGFNLARSDARISLSSNQSLIKIREVFLEVNDQKFSPQEGPVITKDRNARLSFGFDSWESLEHENLVAQIEIHRRDKDGELIREYSSDVSFEEDGLSRIDLQIGDDTDDVYEGTITIVDSGVKVSQIVPFRYIVGGDVIFIQNAVLSSGDDSVNRGEELELEIMYTGPIFDIVSSEIIDLGLPRTDVLIKNEKDSVVYRDSVHVDYSGGISEKITFISAEDARVLSIDISVYDSEGNLLVEYSKVVGDSELVNNPSSTYQIIIFSVMVIILIVVISIVNKFVKKDEEIGSGSGGQGVVVGVFVGLGILLSSANIAEALTIAPLEGSYAPVGVPQVLTLNSPVGDLFPGEGFSIDAIVGAYTCSNGTNHIGYTSTKIMTDYYNDMTPESFGARGLSYLGGGYTGSTGNFYYDTGNLEHESLYIDSDVNPSYIAPTEPGLYYIYLNTQIWARENEDAGWYSYRIPISVVDEDPDSCSTAGDVFKVTKSSYKYKDADVGCKSQYGEDWEFATLSDSSEEYIMNGSNPIFANGSYGIKNTPTDGTPFVNQVCSSESTWPEDKKMALIVISAGSSPDMCYGDVPKGTKKQAICRNTNVSDSELCSVEEDILTVNCSVSPSINAKVGNTVVWTASATGGDGSYTYSWLVSPKSSDSNPDPAIYETVYNSIGPKDASVTVTSGGESVTVQCAGSNDSNGNGGGGDGGGDGITVTEDNDGVCGPIHQKTISAQPTENGQMCSAFYQAPNPIFDDENQKYDWTCEGQGDGDSPSCYADYEPAIDVSNLQINPPIVDPGETCELTWDVEHSSNYTCTIFSDAGSSVTDSSPQKREDVEPGGVYGVRCVDNDNGTEDTSDNTVSCILNPTLIEN